MSFIEDLFGKSCQVTIGDVQLDASLQELHSLEGEITDHGVEEGSDISDNYRVKNRPIMISGLITNTPIATGFPYETAINSIKSLADSGTPVSDSWATIQDYFDSEKIINISTSLQKYEDMALTNFKVRRDSKNGQNLRFEMVARKVRFVSLGLTEAIALKDAATNIAKKQAGAKPGGNKPPKATPAAKNKSAAAKALDKGISAFENFALS